MVKEGLKGYALYSDGGARIHGGAASACILRDLSGQRKFKLLLVLKDVNNTEAELLAALLGFSLVRQLFSLIAAATEKDSLVPVQWYCDHQGLLSTANQLLQKCGGTPVVKNLPYWQVFLNVVECFELNSLYLRGHSGNRFHDGCDKACQWGSVKGEKLLDQYGEGPVGRVASRAPADAWYLLDGRELRQFLRSDAKMLEQSLSAMGKQVVEHTVVSDDR